MIGQDRPADARATFAHGDSRRPASPGTGLMQPPPDTGPATPPWDADALYRAHHRELQRAVARVVRGPRELIEDACQTAWLTLLRTQPNHDTVFAWLRVVAIHEAYRLSAIARRDASLERLRCDDGDWRDMIADPGSLDDALLALEALRALAALPQRRRTDLALKIAGYSYEEIRARTPRRTRTNVNKSLVKARACIRRMWAHDR
jgi:hypothetical protein